MVTTIAKDVRSIRGHHSLKDKKEVAFNATLHLVQVMIAFKMKYDKKMSTAKMSNKNQGLRMKSLC